MAKGGPNYEYKLFECTICRTIATPGDTVSCERYDPISLTWVKDSGAVWCYNVGIPISEKEALERITKCNSCSLSTKDSKFIKLQDYLMGGGLSPT